MYKKINDCLYSGDNKSKLNFAINFLIAIAALLLVFEIIFVSNFTGVYIVDISMMPTLNGAPDEKSAGGDYLYVSDNAKPTYGDIVVVSRENNSPLIKRVIALGGDSVKLIGGKLYIKYGGTNNFILVEEDYINSDYNNPEANINNYPQIGGKVLEEGHTVKRDCVFLMGDNRNYSSDSRQNGDFQKKNICGVVTGWSLKNKKFLSSVHQFFSFDLPGAFGLK